MEVPCTSITVPGDMSSRLLPFPMSLGEGSDRVIQVSQDAYVHLQLEERFLLSPWFPFHMPDAQALLTQATSNLLNCLHVFPELPFPFGFIS